MVFFLNPSFAQELEGEWKGYYDNDLYRNFDIKSIHFLQQTRYIFITKLIIGFIYTFQIYKKIGIYFFCSSVVYSLIDKSKNFFVIIQFLSPYSPYN